jgi:Xaa-Pro aminopeptidase
MRADARHTRLEQLVRVLESEGLDGLLVTSRANIRYLTGFSGSAALVVATRADLLLVTDFRYNEQARVESAAVARIEVEGTNVWERLFRELPTMGALQSLGYEAQALTVKDAERFAQAGKLWRWSPTSDIVERLRASKDANEVAAIRAAATLAGQALQLTLKRVRVGMSELEIAGILEGELRRLGSEGHPFQTIVASGPRTALPHARSSRRTVASGELLLLDFGAQVDGYCADITRTVVVGARATEPIRPRPGSPAARPYGRARWNAGPRSRCVGARSDPGARVRRGVWTLARSRAWARGA